MGGEGVLTLPFQCLHYIAISCYTLVVRYYPISLLKLVKKYGIFPKYMFILLKMGPISLLKIIFHNNLGHIELIVGRLVPALFTM